MMDVLFRCCAGLDVHKKNVVVCVRRVDEGGKVHKLTRTFGTFTRQILEMSDWLAAEGVCQTAMESTGVYWKPIYNLLEGRMPVILVNAAHIKQVPGRKTDAKDCEWIAECLQHGLLRGSFVPPQPLRELRDLTRHRAKLVDSRTAVINRLQKTLEDANIKLASVVTDVTGVSAQDMLQSLVEGVEDPEQLAQMARGRMRGKIRALKLALEGKMTEHHRFMIDLMLREIATFNEFIGQVSAKIEELMRPFAEQIERLKEVPGIDRTTAENIVAEVGVDMSQFPSAAHLASWAGVCPGNNVSAGKRKSGRTTKGNRWLRRALTQAAWAASRTKGTYLSAQYHRLSPRRGKKRAIVAMAHTILQSTFHLLKSSVHYQELGADYFDRLDPEATTRYLVKRLQRLGYVVELKPTPSAA